MRGHENWGVNGGHADHYTWKHLEHGYRCSSGGTSWEHPDKARRDFGGCTEATGVDLLICVRIPVVCATTGVPDGACGVGFGAEHL